jgi:hypothetical protein
MDTTRNQAAPAKPAVVVGVPVAPGRNVIVRLGTQAALAAILVADMAIAAAGRSGVEEVYSVPYLDVRCDVCFHVFGFTTSPH